MNETTIESQVEKISNYMDGFYVSHLINVGMEIGIFDQLHQANGGISVSDLASKLSLHEPYVKTWCQTAHFQEIIEINDEELIKLMPHMDELLADKSSDKYIAGRVRMAVRVHGDRILESPEYYNSGGFTSEYSPDRSDIVAAAIEAPHKSLVFLLSILPEENRLKKRLEQKFRFLDLGCGQGSFLLKMAGTFPNGQYVGIDPIEHGINTGKKKVNELGLSHKISLEIAAGEDLKFENKFDIVCMLLTFHEIMPDVRTNVAEKARNSLKDDGILLIIDFSYPEHLNDFRNKDFGPGIMDQFFETALGISHLNAKEQESMLGTVGFKDFDRISFNGVDILTATK